MNMLEMTIHSVLSNHFSMSARLGFVLGGAFMIS